MNTEYARTASFHAPGDVLLQGFGQLNAGYERSVADARRALSSLFHSPKELSVGSPEFTQEMAQTAQTAVNRSRIREVASLAGHIATRTGEQVVHTLQKEVELARENPRLAATKYGKWITTTGLAAGAGFAARAATQTELGLKVVSIAGGIGAVTSPAALAAVAAGAGTARAVRETIQFAQKRPRGYYQERVGKHREARSREKPLSATASGREKVFHGVKHLAGSIAHGGEEKVVEFAYQTGIRDRVLDQARTHTLSSPEQLDREYLASARQKLRSKAPEALVVRTAQKELIRDIRHLREATITAVDQQDRETAYKLLKQSLRVLKGVGDFEEEWQKSRRSVRGGFFRDTAREGAISAVGVGLIGAGKGVAAFAAGAGLFDVGKKVVEVAGHVKDVVANVAQTVLNAPQIVQDSKVVTNVAGVTIVNDTLPPKPPQLPKDSHGIIPHGDHNGDDIPKPQADTEPNPARDAKVQAFMKAQRVNENVVEPEIKYDPLASGNSGSSVVDTGKPVALGESTYNVLSTSKNISTPSGYTTSVAEQSLLNPNPTQGVNAHVNVASAGNQNPLGGQTVTEAVDQAQMKEQMAEVKANLAARNLQPNIVTENAPLSAPQSVAASAFKTLTVEKGSSVTKAMIDAGLFTQDFYSEAGSAKPVLDSFLDTFIARGKISLSDAQKLRELVNSPEWSDKSFGKFYAANKGLIEGSISISPGDAVTVRTDIMVKPIDIHQLERLADLERRTGEDLGYIKKLQDMRGQESPPEVPPNAPPADGPVKVLVFNKETGMYEEVAVDPAQKLGTDELITTDSGTFQFNKKTGMMELVKKPVAPPPPPVTEESSPVEPESEGGTSQEGEGNQEANTLPEGKKKDDVFEATDKSSQAPEVEEEAELKPDEVVNNNNTSGSKFVFNKETGMAELVKTEPDLPSGPQGESESDIRFNKETGMPEYTRPASSVVSKPAQVVQIPIGPNGEPLANGENASVVQVPIEVGKAQNLTTTQDWERIIESQKIPKATADNMLAQFGFYPDKTTTLTSNHPEIFGPGSRLDKVIYDPKVEIHEPPHYAATYQVNVHGGIIMWPHSGLWAGRGEPMEGIREWLEGGISRRPLTEAQITKKMSDLEDMELILYTDDGHAIQLVDINLISHDEVKAGIIRGYPPQFLGGGSNTITTTFCGRSASDAIKLLDGINFPDDLADEYEVLHDPNATESQVKAALKTLTNWLAKNDPKTYDTYRWMYDGYGKDWNTIRSNYADFYQQKRYETVWKILY
ncbi:hypothetical protein HYW55_00785 [Candidatus Gottesmanbacteria bacterium]|nr:hypothetical protein [Candidatus Gottesmanbacteria bacterium]